MIGVKAVFIELKAAPATVPTSSHSKACTSGDTAAPVNEDIGGILRRMQPQPSDIVALTRLLRHRPELAAGGQRLAALALLSEAVVQRGDVEG